MKKTCVIFDFDGVIIESETQSFKLISDILKHKYSISVPKELITKKIGKPTISFLNEYFSSQLKQKDIDNAYQEYKTKSFQILEESLFPHHEVIKFIKNNYQKYTIAIASMNTKKFIDIVLSKLNIDKYINIIVTRNNVSCHKPNPEIYLKTLKMLNCLPNNAIIIEDSPKGIKSANRAGIDCIGILNKHNTHIDFSKVKTKRFIKVENFNSEFEKYLN